MKLFSKRPKKIFMVIGYCWEENGFGCSSKNAYPIVTEHAVFSTYAKAKKEIKEIIKETKQEAQEMDYPVEIEWKDDFDTLEITFKDTGTVENWVIYERTLDK